MRSAPTRALRPRASTAATALLLLVGSACAQPLASPVGSASVVRPADVRRALGVLAHDSMAGRFAGSPGAASAARFIARELRRHSVAPAYGGTGDSAYFQRVPLVLARQESGDTGLALAPSWAAWNALPAAERAHDVNVVGVVRGSDPRLSDEAVVVGAHFDHIGIGDALDGDSVYNGADDDASGVVAVLEIARALAAAPPRRTVVLLLTTAEEQGMLGTRWYVQDPLVPLDRTVADLQVEMIGRPDSLAGGVGRAWLTGYERSGMGEALAAAGAPIVADPRPQYQFFMRSDNIVFACRGIPAHTLSSYNLHADYHSPDDEIERMDFDHLTSVVQASVDAVRLLADGPRPAWKPGGSPVAEEACGVFR